MSTDDATKAAVTVDMERIFGGLARREMAGQAPIYELSTTHAVKPKAARSPKTWLIAFVAVLLAGSALAMLMLLRAAYRPMLKPASSSSAILGSTSARQIVPAAQPAAPIPAAASTTVNAIPAPAPSPNRSPDVPSDTRQAPPGSDERAAAPSSRTARSRPPRAESSATSICRNSSDPEQCLYREVRSADLRLREAYDWAADLGVPVNEMRQVRRLWNRTLDRSADDPIGTIRTLDTLATRLYNAPDGIPNGSRR